jgi:hypothetical protein
MTRSPALSGELRRYTALLLASLALYTPAVGMTALVAVAVVVDATAAFADDDGPGDDDDDGDDDTPGTGDDDPAPPPGEEPALATGEIEPNFDDGPNVSPDDDCFLEAQVRPPWSRGCTQPPVVEPPPAVAPQTRAPSSGPRLAAAPPTPVTEPPRVIPREVVLFRVTPAQLTQLQTRGFTVVLSRDLAGSVVARLRVPGDVGTREGLSLARSIAPSAMSDFNHVYGVYRPGSGRCDTPACKQRAAVSWPTYPGGCSVSATIGMIDTLVDASNPALAGQNVEVVSVVAPGRQSASPLHGTAIAALMSGRSDVVVPGLLSRSRLVAVSAFHKATDGEDIADTFDIVVAIDTLVQRNVRVINSSFAGPANRVLEQAVKFATGRGVVIVASSGNAGPGSPPLYPAAYDDVIAVTGVAADERVYRLANRGTYVDFAAPGVDVQVVSTQAEPRFETGTSFAAPFISAALAAALAREPGKPASAIVQSLQKTARDLGPPGRDPVFGWGLLQAGNVCP